jgi:hypothetical protein
MKGVFEMRIHYHYIREIMLPLIVCLFLLLSPVSAPWADTDQQGAEESKGSAVELSREKVTLQKKTSSMVSTRFGKRYGINNATMIIGLKGEQLQIQYLLVPCDAELVYETSSDGTRRVHRIQVLSVHEKATNQMEGKLQ